MMPIHHSEIDYLPASAVKILPVLRKPGVSNLAHPDIFEAAPVFRYQAITPIAGTALTSYEMGLLAEYYIMRNLVTGWSVTTTNLKGASTNRISRQQGIAIRNASDSAIVRLIIHRQPVELPAYPAPLDETRRRR